MNNDIILLAGLVLVVYTLVLFVFRRVLKNSLIFKLMTIFLTVDLIIGITCFVAGKIGFVHFIWGVPLCLATMGTAYYLVHQNIHQPLATIGDNILKLSKGNLQAIQLQAQNSEGRIDEIMGIQQALRSHIVSLRETASFASDIQYGIFDNELNALSDQDTLRLALITMRDNLKAIINESKTVVKEASEDGKLTVRVATEGKSGDWKELAESLNQLLGSFSSPLVNLNNIISAMAQGDLSIRYTEAAKGDILNMANNLNLALDNIDGLLHQIFKSANTIEQSSSEMRVSSDEMSISTSEIASAIAQMSNGAHNQVSKVDEVSNLVEGILSSSNEMGQKADTIFIAAKAGTENSQKGMEILNTVLDSMGDISTYSRKTNESIKVLIERSNEITRVLGMITEIATQTNMLALNAAIEAAQAGDAGRGFAVVAEQIRKLAEDSKKSAQEIELLVTDVQEDTREAARIMDEMAKIVKTGVENSRVASGVFEEIIESSNETLNYSEVILNSAKQQISHIHNVVTITESIVVIAEETAAGTEQVASSAAELSSGMDTYNQKTQKLAEIAELLKEGLNMVKLSGKGSENTTIFKMKEAYEKEKYLLDAMLNHMPDYIYFKDLQSLFIRNSMSHTKRFGFSDPKELVGKSDFDFHGKHAQKAFDDEQRIITTREPILNRVEKVDLKTGEVSYLSTTKLPLLDLQGNVVGTYGITRNITETHLSEIRATEQAKQLLASQDELKMQVNERESIQTKLDECRSESEKLKQQLSIG